MSDFSPEPLQPARKPRGRRPEPFRIGGGPWYDLLSAILIQAIHDRRQKSYPMRAEDARLWLVSLGSGWLIALGIDVGEERWVAWVNAGCPKNALFKMSNERPTKAELSVRLGKRK